MDQRKNGKARILHLGKYSYDSEQAGGIESVLKSYTEHLEIDFNQIVVVLDRSIRKETIIIENNIKIIILPVHVVAGYAPVNLFMFFHLRRIIKSFAPDIIHVHMPSLMPFFFLYGLKKWKTVVHWHADVDGTKISKSFFFPLYRQMEKYFLKITDTIIVTSLQYLDSSRSLQPFKKKCCVIPIGISNNRNCLLSKKEISPEISRFIEGKKLILSIGRLSYYKGYEFLIKSIRYLKDDKAVLLIGGNGPEMESLQKTVSRYHLQEKVFLPGKISECDKEKLSSKALVFCLPSIDRAEAFGLSLVEAMSHSLPIVTADVTGSGMNHVNIHNKTGIKVAPCDSRALGEALNKLLDSPGLMRELGENGNKRFLDFFQSRDVAAKIKNQYENLLRGQD